MARRRADQLLVAQGLARTRSQAQALIERGSVSASGRRIEKPSALLADDVELDVKEPLRFVSRGGDKLDGALDDFGMDVSGMLCLDIGASTGGFTDCLLQRAARRVYAVDVGRHLLADKLRIDPRVVARDETNARNLERADFEESFDLAVVDASFIGVDKLLPALTRILPSGARVLILVKPQFEVGPAEARRARGVIRDDRVREEAVTSARSAIASAGFEIVGTRPSRVPGRDGNVEYFVLARKI